MQFCPDAVFRKCVIELDIAKGKFVAKARFLAEAGWRTLLGSKERDEENDGTPLPVVAKGDELLCEKGEVVERQTQPPHPPPQNPSTVISSVKQVCAVITVPRLFFQLYVLPFASRMALP